MTSTDTNKSDDHTSTLSTEEKIDHENKSSDHEDEKDSSLDELVDDEEMRVCKSIHLGIIFVN